VDADKVAAASVVTGKTASWDRIGLPSGTRFFGFLLLVVSLAAHPASAIKVPRGIDSCPTLDACLALLNNVNPTNDVWDIDNSNILARGLSRFGDSAKHELLKRAVGSDPGWRSTAAGILGEWKTWEPSDVPALLVVLHTDQGEWAAEPLAKIATPDALQALVEHLPHERMDYASTFLSNLGARAVPYLFPLLQDDEKYKSADRVIAAMDPHPIAFVAGWVTIALDPEKDVKERLAALRGIAALGQTAASTGPSLHGLLNDSNDWLLKQVHLTLRAIHDPIVVNELAQSCKPTASSFDFLALNSNLCLREIAEYDLAARDSGSFLLSFLSSKNGAERAYGITTLGLISYAPAIPQIEEALNSRDWRIVNAAIWSLGWLGDKNAIPQLDEIASTHWLPELKDSAARVAGALRSPQGRIEHAPWKLRSGDFLNDPFTVVADGIGRGMRPCKGNTWIWNGNSFRLFASHEDRVSSLQFRNGNMWGELVGTNNGEWGGQLAWRPLKGQPLTLLRDNVVDMKYASGAAIVLFGLAHMSFNYGYMLKVSRNSDGTWDEAEVARLPGVPGAWTDLSPDLFAIHVNGRVVIVSAKDGILGLAQCASK
jgi:HEAT repeat protein